MSAPPFKVKATYEYNSPHEDDLSFPQGQIITVTEEEDADWYIGEYTDASGAPQSGLFPKNFVDRYEPAAPPRPSRSTRPKQAEPAPQPPAPEPVAETPSAKPSEPKEEPAEPTPQPSVASPPSVEPAPKQAPAPAPSAPPSSAAPESAKPKPTGKAPPPVAEKPSSFRDRIAAFNKPAAAPIAPFKPGGLGAGGFIKKPFVAPPPSRDAYVPPPREPAPQKVYRRDEDPEIAERRAQDQDNAEKAGLAPAGEQEEGEAPKAVSLKERIALLQKQQAEQAARRGDASIKEKPKKPLKRTQTSESVEQLAQSEESLPPRASTEVAEAGEAAPRSHHAPRPTDTRFSDGNDADQSAGGETTEAEGASTGMEEEAPKRVAPVQAEEEEEEQEEDVTESPEEEEMDEEARHQMALRERMAKLSGGMGMPGMFGPAGGMPMMGMGGAPKKKKPQEPRAESLDEEPPTPLAAPRIPIMPMPELSRKMSSDSARYQRTSIDEQAPAVPPLPKAAPTADHPQAAAVDSPSPGSETDDELPGTSQAPAPDLSASIGSPPPLPSSPPVPRRQESFAKRPQEMAYDSSPSTSGQPFPIPDRGHTRAAPVSPEGLASRLPPPIPTASSSQQPTEFMHRKGFQAGPGGESEYEGDYDTDIASSAKHKDALKAHVREPSHDESTIANEPRSPPPIPSSPPQSRAPAHRAAPPPPPSQPPPRTSVDSPRAPPPPVPQNINSPRDEDEDDDYDPYRYGAPPPAPSKPSGGHGPPPPIGIPPRMPSGAAPPPVASSSRPPPPSGPPPLPISRNLEPEDSSEEESNGLRINHGSLPPSLPPPIAQPRSSAAPPPPAEQPTPRSARSSVEAERSQPPRRSTEQHRLPTNHEYIATEVDLGESSVWWSQPDVPPPVFQNRKDVFFEIEESSTSKRGGKTTVTKDVYVLFQDYSQTVVSVRFDAKNPADAQLEQRHEAPPQRLRQDQLEDSHAKFGAKIADAVNSAMNSTVGDGSPQALVLELLKPYKNVLMPVGSRAYGALVYANLANATVQQHDEIRPGDIVSFRNAKFQGKHSGVMHQKYNLEAGKPDHVGIVVEWDGTKKKIRAVEQGRESKKCKVESFRLGDLRSGEVRVWRVMERSWIGWDSE